MVKKCCIKRSYHIYVVTGSLGFSCLLYPYLNELCRELLIEFNDPYREQLIEEGGFVCGGFILLALLLLIVIAYLYC